MWLFLGVCFSIVVVSGRGINLDVVPFWPDQKSPREVFNFLFKKIPSSIEIVRIVQ